MVKLLEEEKNTGSQKDFWNLCKKILCKKDTIGEKVL